jgi:NADPH:quinone reductase-like Zn-dependent oxidoreductase
VQRGQRVLVHGAAGAVGQALLALGRLAGLELWGTAHGAHAALRSRGAAFVDPPHLIARLPDHDLWMAFCRDSEGNLLGLMSEVRAPAA